PDRPAGRHLSPTPTPIARWGERHGLDLFKPDRVNDPEAVGRIGAADASAFVVVAYGKKLGPELLRGVCAINLHGSLLPKYRGAAPINWAVINQERQTGLSVITVAERMDAGDVLAQQATPIDPMETAGELHDRLAELGPPLVSAVLARYESGHLEPRPQDESQATHAARLSKADGTVRFDQPAAAVRARVHGLTPWPGCRVRLGPQALRLARVDVSDGQQSPGRPGEVLPDRAVACAEGSVRLLAVQPPGGRLMSFDAYCHGHDVPPGVCFEPL
ncbi:MAG: methionyl-tRNA formyltransferase, partial [Planctomycetota bacterium]